MLMVTDVDGPLSPSVICFLLEDEGDHYPTCPWANG